MTSPNETYGWEQTKSIWNNKNYRFFYRILGGALLVAIGVLIGASLFAEKQIDYLMSLFTNVLSIFVTVFVLDELAQKREERQKDYELKERLILQMGSPNNSLAIEATRILRQKQWLTDGSISGAILIGANLMEADLMEATLKECILTGANLNNANLEGADLTKADLTEVSLDRGILVRATCFETQLESSSLKATWLMYANLNKANLNNAVLESSFLLSADLSYASLQRTNLRNSYSWNVNFRGANLRDADLAEAHFWGMDPKEKKFIDGKFNLKGLQVAQFNTETILPDGTYWRSQTDMSRFTDPNHPNFWRSDDPYSPAYHSRKID